MSTRPSYQQKEDIDYKCQKCGGDIRSIPFAYRYDDATLEACLGLHSDYCNPDKD